MFKLYFLYLFLIDINLNTKTHNKNQFGLAILYRRKKIIVDLTESTIIDALTNYTM